MPPKTFFTLRYHWKAVLIWSCLGIAVFAVSVGFGWVESRPNVARWAPNEVTVVAHRFCVDEHCLRFCQGDAVCVAENDAAWRTIIHHAAQEWDDVGADFRFYARTARGDEAVCQPQRGEVHVIVLYPGTQLCGGEPAASYTDWGALLYYGTPFRASDGIRTARIYINALHQHRLQDPIRYQSGMLLHELGHLARLGHPDEAGQNVAAIMNGRTPHAHLQPDDKAGILALHGERQAPKPTAVFLENPRNTSPQSGLGVISGWVCEAESLTLTITPAGNWQELLVYMAVPYGGDRADTESQCGDTNNGFGLLFNWNLLGDGAYYVMVETEDGRYSWNPVTVTTLGREFAEDLAGRFELDGFPHAGASVTVEWSESLQNFVIVEHDPNGGTP